MFFADNIVKLNMDRFYFACCYVAFLTVLLHVRCIQSQTENDCPEGYFLERDGNCAQCGKCLNGTACDRLYGACPGGECEIWYTPQPYCYRFIPVDESYLSLAHLVGGPTIQNISSDEVMLSFKQIADIPKELERYSAYSIQYSTQHNGDWNVERNIGSHANYDVSMKIHDLRPNTRYYFRVVLQRIFRNTHTDFVTSSSVRSALTTCTHPDRPEFSSSQQSKKGILLKWKPFISNCNYIRAATLKYNVRGNLTSSYLSLSTGSTNELEVRRLKTRTEYEFVITLSNDEGLSTTGREISVYKDGDKEFENPCTLVERGVKDCPDRTDNILFILLITVLTISILAIVAAIVFAVLFFKERKRNSSSPVQVHYESNRYEKPVHNQRTGTLPNVPQTSNEGTYDCLNYDKPSEERIPLTPTEISTANDLPSSYITPVDRTYDGERTYMTPLPEPEECQNGRHVNEENVDTANNRDSYLRPVCH